MRMKITVFLLSSVLMSASHAAGVTRQPMDNSPSGARAAPTGISITAQPTAPHNTSISIDVADFDERLQN